MTAEVDSGEIVLGTTAGPVRTYVDPNGVAAFGAAINDDNVRYADGSSTPPTYAVTAALPVVSDLPAHSAAVLERTRAMVHGEHDLRIYRPILPGTFLHTTAERVGAHPTPAGMVVVQLVRATDDNGDVLVEQHWVTVLICAATGEGRGVMPPDHTFPDAARNRPLGTISLRTTPDQTFRYAGASGDRDPMHVDDEVARERGFPRKFNQGLCTVGIATQGLMDLTSSGDPTRVQRVAVRFAAPAFPGDAIDLDVYDAGTTNTGAAAFAFEARSGGAAVLRHGRFEVLPD
jgi:acyl dehydratase